MKRKKYDLLILSTLSALIIGLTILGGLRLYDWSADNKKEEAGQILHLYQENIEGKLASLLNAAYHISTTIETTGIDNVSWFPAEADKLFKRPEVRYVSLFNHDTVVYAFPAEAYSSQIGKTLKDFPYIYTMGKSTRRGVVDGPITMPETGAEVFLFIGPVLNAANTYQGEVAVAMDKAYIIDQLELSHLTEQGYDYELWRIEPQNGNKQIVAQSTDIDDYSEVANTAFAVPVPWNLTIQPQEGWVSDRIMTWLVGSGMVLDTLLLVLLFTGYRNIRQKRQIAFLCKNDMDTGLYTGKGFKEALDIWLTGKKTPLVMFYFVLDKYKQISHLAGQTQESLYLSSISSRINNYIRYPFLAGRIGDNNFIVAVHSDMSETEMADFAKGLSLELLWKINLDGTKLFVNAKYEYMVCPDNSQTSDEYITSLISRFHDRLKHESPIRMLTDKFRQLLQGNRSIVFDEYTDPDMMALSKTLNQYRKKMEQLEYFDMIFYVGNRLKYMRDAEMLISYNKERKFTLFCIDICAFSRYNELFSVAVGDMVLQEVINRLREVFGEFLYRINGDIFLGLSVGEDSTQHRINQINKLFTEPVTAGIYQFTLQKRLAVCHYSQPDETPAILLSHIQSALSYAKAENELTIIYDSKLDSIIKSQMQILKCLQRSLKDSTLEVWYQPLWELKYNRFTALEALLRLPDGNGGYFSAFQVVTIAERNGLIDAIGHYVLQKTCQFMVEHGVALGIKRACINLSVQQLMVDNSVDSLLQHIKQTGLSPSYVTLEITESILIQSIDKAVNILERLRKAGINIALDDFGVGYSSLNYLANLPITSIKVDRSLLKEVMVSKKQYSLLKSIIEVANINHINIVIEGVETKDEQEMISQLDINYIQGYYYARPMPEKKLIALLKEHQ